MFRETLFPKPHIPMLRDTLFVPKRIRTVARLEPRKGRLERPMGITERLANLSIPSVLIIVVVLLALRYILLKQRSPIAKSIAEISESLAVAMALVFLIIRPFIIQAFFIPSPSMVPTLLTDDHIMVNKFIYRFREPARGDIVVFKSPPEAGKDEADFIKRVVAIPGDLVRITPGYVAVGDAELNHDNLRGLLGIPGSSRIKLTNDQILADGKSIKPEEIANQFEEPDAEVTVHPGAVYINGKAIKEPYTAEDPNQPYPGGPMFHVEREWLAKDKHGNKVVKIPKDKLLVMGDNRNDSNDARSWGLLDRWRVRGKAMFIFWPLGRIRWLH